MVCSLRGEKNIVTHGVTSVDNPLPIDHDTLFGIGSVSKTFTATALMRLVADGTASTGEPDPSCFRRVVRGHADREDGCAAAPYKIVVSQAA